MNKLASYESVSSAIEGCFGAGVHVIDRSYVGGGDINDAACLKLSNGKRVFVKSNSLSNRGFFDAEEKGLNAIAATNTIGIPKLLCKGTDKNTSFLMMEMIEEGARAKDSWEVFGTQNGQLWNGMFIRKMKEPSAGELVARYPLMVTRVLLKAFRSS